MGRGDIPSYTAENIYKLMIGALLCEPGRNRTLLHNLSGCGFKHRVDKNGASHIAADCGNVLSVLACHGAEIHIDIYRCWILDYSKEIFQISTSQESAPW